MQHGSGRSNMPKRHMYTKDTLRACALERRGVCYSLSVCSVSFQKIVFSKKMGAASFRRSVPWQSEPGNQIKAALPTQLKSNYLVADLTN